MLDSRIRHGPLSVVRGPLQKKRAAGYSRPGIRCMVQGVRERYLILNDRYWEKVTSCGLRVTGHGLRVAGYGLRVVGYGLR